MKDIKGLCYIPNLHDLRGHPRIIAALSDALSGCGYSIEDIKNMDGDKLDSFRRNLGRNIDLPVTREKHIIIKSIQSCLSSFSEQLLDQYFSTDFIVSDRDYEFVLNIGRASDNLLELYQFNKVETCAFMTAYNPDGKPVSDKENYQCQQRLIEDLDKRKIIYFKGEGKGRNSEWPAEPSLCILGLTCGEAIGLASEFAQLALVWAAKDAVPRIIVIGGTASQNIHLKRCASR